MDYTSRSFALLRESIDCLEDPTLQDDLRIILQEKYTWSAVNGAIHVVGCSYSRAAEKYGSAQSITHTLEEIWGKLCDACPEPVGALLGHVQGEVILQATQLIAATCYNKDAPLLGAHDALERALKQIRRYHPGSYNWEQVAEAQSIWHQLREEAREDPQGHLQQQAAFQMAGSDLLVKKTNWGTTSAERLFLRAATSAWQAGIMGTDVDPFEVFASLGYRSETERSAFWRIIPQIDWHHDQNLQDDSTFLVAVPTIVLEKSNDLLWGLVGQISVQKGAWSFQVVSRTVGRYLSHSCTSTRILGEVTARDTPAIMETARTLYADVLSEEGDILAHEDALLQTARLLNP